MGLSQPHSRSHLELGGPNSGRPVTRKFDATTRRISFLRASLHRTSSLRADPLNSQYAGPCRPKAKKAGFFIYFIFSFFTKIYFHVPNLHEYTPAALLPGGRDLAARPPGSRAADAYLQKKSTKNCVEVPGGPAARQRGGRGIFL